MRHDKDFAVRYITEEPVPVRDIIESLRNIETVLNETGKLFSKFIDGPIQDLANDTGKTPLQIKQVLRERCGEPTMTKRVANAASRFVTLSKRLESAPVEVNDRKIDHETVQGVTEKRVKLKLMGHVSGDERL